MEQKQYKRTTVTAALPYANGGVHIGHLAGVYVPADIFARYLRLKKEDVVFIGGSDEHGVPITIRARKEGVTPQDVVDRFHSMIKKSFEDFGISFDIYSRTTSPTHHDMASNFFKKLYDDGKLLEKETEQYYDEEAHQFLADRYITGECPHCHNEGAYGDQCEKCGRDLSPTELLHPRSTISGSQPVMKKTKNWYLPLDKYQDWLKEWILEGHKEWRPNVYGQCKSWLDLDLQPRAMTRDLDWGIPVPVEGAEGKVLYVWFDAPIGYISNTKELLPDTWEKWWKDPETRLVHFIGKDNIVFHCIVFPVMLKAHGGYSARKRSGERVPELGRRQDIYFEELGGVATRILGGFPRQARRAEICAYGQRTRNKRQQLYVERLPRTQQQRACGRVWQLRQQGFAAYKEVFRRSCSCLRRTERGGQTGLRRV